MIVDFENHKPIRVGEILTKFSLHPMTIHRWITRGIVVRGVRVKLAAEKIGGKWMTTWEAWGAFRVATNPHAQTPEAKLTAEQIKAQIEQQRKHRSEVRARLRARGIKVPG